MRTSLAITFLLMLAVQLLFPAAGRGQRYSYGKSDAWVER